MTGAPSKRCGDRSRGIETASSGSTSTIITAIASVIFENGTLKYRSTAHGLSPHIRVAKRHS
jgi:hypothetical protein